MTRGLTGRMLVVSTLLAILVGSAFVILLFAIADLRGATDVRRQTREQLVAAEELEKLVLDLETGLRGFVITSEERFLEPWRHARAVLPESEEQLAMLVADDTAQLARVRRIVRAATSYIEQYTVPLVAAVRRGDASAQTVARTEAGRQRVDALRASFDSFRESARADLSRRETEADDAARRASVGGGIGVAGSILLILAFTGYLTRVIVQPVRRAALMADRIARGDLSARLSEADVAEIGALERSFNVMAGSLEKSRDELASLAAEQAALRRIATLVARGVAPADVFAATAKEASQLLATDATALCRYEADGEVTVVALESEIHECPGAGARATLEGENVSGDVFRTGLPSRRDSFEGANGPIAAAARKGGIRSSVGAPIVVEGRLWGVMAVSSRDSLPADIEQRLVNFTELVATAIANAESRGEVDRLLEEQASLRRLATLVARGVPAYDVFAAVAEEIGRFVSIDGTMILRYAADGTATVIAGWSTFDVRPEELQAGALQTLEGESVSAQVFRTGQPARIDRYANAGGVSSKALHEAGVQSAVGAPIVVEGRLWGVVAAGSLSPEPLPSGMEFRMADFTELLATAIANAESRAELTASRARIVVASDEARRRIERDLHDGAQQRLVSLGLELRLAQSEFPPALRGLERVIGRVADELDGVIEDLREISRGIHPAILAEGGLPPALRTLARRSAVPVKLDVHLETRFPWPIEVATYYVVSEALTNAARHARASEVLVDLVAENGTLRLSVRDDGRGGADPADGSGLVGLRDRVEALGGTIEIRSPTGSGTSLVVTLPLEGEPMAGSNGSMSAETADAAAGSSPSRSGLEP